jgi:hypothetical protein
MINWEKNVIFSNGSISAWKNIGKSFKKNLLGLQKSLPGTEHKPCHTFHSSRPSGFDNLNIC